MLDQHALPNAPLRAAADEARQVAAAHAARADTEGRLPPESVKAVLTAGFARHFVPRRWGGHEGGFADVLDAVRVLGEGCAATAWIASLSAGVARMAAFLPDEGRRALWGEGPDTLLVGGLVPSGSATATGDGWLLDGTWPYVSGVGFADWALVCGRVPRGGDGVLRFFALPRGAFRVEETWDSVGMRATGSHTLVAERAAVPAHLSFPYEDLLRGGARGGACYRVPHKAVNGLSFAAPVLGAARGLLGSWTDWDAPRPEVVRAGAEIDAAQLLLERVATAADTGDHGALPTARATRDCAVAAELLATATGRLFRAFGTRGQSASHPAQRAWRDVSTATTHAALRFPAAVTAFGAAAQAAQETR
ncbi:acyl-CoA dehydrogenase family protein [Streptomyces sp. G45]|uniref:acyl-CoA dehydrogenase family protein n=1 Tax=Streptomyces sp. G45 TaxID=3406627 RepID=UPI003C1B6502